MGEGGEGGGGRQGGGQTQGKFQDEKCAS